jgi:hypothetical protein
MKKITLLFILCLTFASWSNAQCTNQTSQWPSGTVTINDESGLQTIATNNYSQNEFSVLDGLVVGNEYTVTTDISTYITVSSDGTDAGIIDSGLDSISFTATTTGIYIYWTLDAACADGPSENVLTQIECTTCSCSATTAPDVAIAVSPLDGATDVVLVATTSGSPGVAFEWSDNGAGTTTSLTVVGEGTLPDASSPTLLSIPSDFQYDTTYEWTITSTNCLGTVSSTFSFTTESDPLLNVASFDAKSFTVYPNPTADVLKIQSNEAVNSVAVYNLLGKQVMLLKGDQISNNSLNVSNLTKGVYFITIEANGKNEKLKFIKK